jgi:hypothetical protein
MFSAGYFPGEEAITMQRIRSRSELLGQITELKAENKRLKGALDEIADIVNDDESQDETDQDHALDEDEDEDR